MANYVITDLGNDVQVHMTGDVADIKYTLNKLTLRVKQTANQVLITNGDSFENPNDNLVLYLDYQSVTSPVYASNDELFSGLLGMVSGVSLGSSGAGGGGGDTTWSTASKNFVAIPTVGAATITISGLSWTPEAENVAAIIKYSSTGDKETLNTSNVTVSGGVITLGNEDDFEVGDTVSVYLTGPQMAYDQGLDARTTFVLNPEYANYTSVEHLVDQSAMTVGDYYYVIPAEGFKNLHIHWRLTTNNAGDTVTMDIYETNNAAADDSATTNWVDKTTELLSASKVATGVTATEEDTIQIVDRTPLKYMIHINVVSAGDTGTADVYIKKS